MEADYDKEQDVPRCEDEPSIFSSPAMHLRGARPTREGHQVNQHQGTSNSPSALAWIVMALLLLATAACMVGWHYHTTRAAAARLLQSRVRGWLYRQKQWRMALVGAVLLLQPIARGWLTRRRIKMAAAVAIQAWARQLLVTQHFKWCVYSWQQLTDSGGYESIWGEWCFLEQWPARGGIWRLSAARRMLGRLRACVVVAAAARQRGHRAALLRRSSVRHVRSR